MQQDRAQHPGLPVPSDIAGRALRSLVLLVLALPWLNPTAGGPSAVIQPWLVAATATVLAWHLVAPAVTRTQLALAVLAAALLAGAGHAAPPVMLAIGGLLVIALGAAIAASPATRGWMVQAIADAWLVAALVSSLLALVQYFGLSPQFAPWVNSTEPGEAFANLRQRNLFASLTSIGLASLLWRAQQGARPSWALPAAVLLAVANAATASRTGALQIALLVALTLWWTRSGRRGAGAVCLAAVFAYGLAAIVLPLLLEQTTGVTAASAFRRLVSADGCSSRVVLWGNVLHLIAQKPWLGWGWGELDYAHFATLYPGERFCDILDNAHNLPLHIAVELGVPVALLGCAGLAWWLHRQRPWIEPAPQRQLAWSVIAVILLHSLLEYPLWYGPFQMAFGFSLGLLARGREAGGSGSRDIGPLGRGTVSTLLTLALAYAAWDYHRVSQLYVTPDQRSALYRGRPLPQTGDSWLFRDQLAFAELSLTPLTRDNAPAVHALAMDLLHYSPEPRVIETALEGAMYAGREDRALWLLERFRAAFPADAAKAAAAPPPASDPRLRH
jgi:O-antigen ligase